MRDYTLGIIEENWKKRRARLDTALGIARTQVENILKVEGHYRHEHTNKETLAKSFGNFADQLLDVGSISTVLAHGDEKRLMPEDRYTRLKTTSDGLGSLEQTLKQNPLAPEVVSMDLATSEIFEKFEAHMARCASIFRLYRIASLEGKAAYQPSVHDSFINNYDWRHFTADEAGLCPPFIVRANASKNRIGLIGKLTELLTSGRPLKIVFEPVDLCAIDDDPYFVGRAAMLRTSLDLELFPLFLRNIYVMQGLVQTGNEAEKAFEQGMFSPRPALLSVIFARSGEDANGAEARASKAVLSRAFPGLLYNPDESSEFVLSLKLIENPSSDSVWPTIQYNYLTDDGIQSQHEMRYTFADFAAEDPSLGKHFEALSSDIPENRLEHIAEFLELEQSQRAQKIPFAFGLDARQRLLRLRPSSEIIARTAERMHVWHTLQELSGVHNPHVRMAVQLVKMEMEADKVRAIEALRQEQESSLQEAKAQAVSSAITNLASRLTGVSAEALVGSPGSFAAGGVSGSSTHNGTQTVAAAAVSAPAVKQAAGTAETAWIDSVNCTSCDDCISLNKNIFGYNKDKKAYVKNPKGGPFKDIVKAAEKCPARIIHPGQPQDPKEKDLEKLIKRAATYQ